MNRLIKAKISFTTEIVVENHYEEADLQKVALSAFRANRDEIVSQALETDSLEVQANPIESLKDLPERWTGDCLPWLPSIAFGNRKQEQRIKEFLPK